MSVIHRDSMHMSKVSPDVAVVGRPHLSSSSRLSSPILKCAAHIFTAAYEGAVSLSVATISSWLSFGDNLIFMEILDNTTMPDFVNFQKSAGTTFQSPEFQSLCR